MWLLGCGGGCFFLFGAGGFGLGEDPILAVELGSGEAIEGGIFLGIAHFEGDEVGEDDFCLAFEGVTEEDVEAVVGDGDDFAGAPLRTLGVLDKTADGVAALFRGQGSLTLEKGRRIKYFTCNTLYRNERADDRPMCIAACKIFMAELSGNKGANRVALHKGGGGGYTAGEWHI
jgi:hypothetical protein